VRELDHARVVQSWLRQHRRGRRDGDAVDTANPATGKDVSAEALQDASLSALGDMFAVVVPKASDVPS
jgi:hypothetical protein